MDHRAWSTTLHSNLLDIRASSRHFPWRDEPRVISREENDAWVRRKKQNDWLGKAFMLAGLSKQAGKMLTCPACLHWRHTSDGWQLYPWSACGTLLCFSCSARYYRARRHIHAQALQEIAAFNPGHIALSATLTVGSCPISRLKLTKRLLHEAYNRLLHTKPFGESIGYVRATEIPTKGTEANPHMHILHLLPAGTDTSGLAGLWKRSARLDGHPEIDLQYPRTTGDFARLANYLTKKPIEVSGETLADTHATAELYRQLSRGRLFDATGPFRAPKAKKKALFPAERRPVNLFRWSESAREYVAA